jgi:hypothetical protein
VITIDGREIECRTTRVLPSGAIEVVREHGSFELPARQVKAVVRSSSADAPEVDEADGAEEVDEAERESRREARQERALLREAERLRAAVEKAQGWCERWETGVAELKATLRAAEVRLPQAERLAEKRRRQAELLRHTCLRRCVRPCRARIRQRQADKDRAAAEVAAGRIRGEIRTTERDLRKTRYNLKKSRVRLEQALERAADCGDLRGVGAGGVFEVGPLDGLTVEPSLVRNEQGTQLTAAVRNHSATTLRGVRLSASFHDASGRVLASRSLGCGVLPAGGARVLICAGPPVGVRVERVSIRRLPASGN